MIKPLAAIVAAFVAPGICGMDSASIERVEDNIADCSPAVVDGISKLRTKYKDIHFQCESGFLRKLLVPPDADIFLADPEEFVRSNWSLFLPKPPKKIPDWRHERKFDSGAHTSAHQFYRDVEIWGAVVFFTKPVRRSVRNKGVEEKDYGMLFAHVLDTSAWDLGTDKVLSAGAAESAARALDEKNGIKANEYRAEAIRYIKEDFCRRGPALVVRVNAWDSSNGAKLRIIPVSVETGQACEWK